MTKAKLAKFLEDAHDWASWYTGDENPIVFRESGITQYFDPIQERTVEIYNDGRIVCITKHELPQGEINEIPPTGGNHIFDYPSD